MYVQYSEYTGLGYKLIPQGEFVRYEAKVRKVVDRYCFDRVNADNATEDNKRGMCEIADEYYMENNPQLDNENKIVASFANEGYSETYVQAKQASADTIKTVEDKVKELVSTYFTAEQRYRGV